MKFPVRYFIFILLLLGSRDIFAQVFEQISSVNNQSIEEVKGINQDDFGYMWFSTKEGVFRYDGHQLIALVDLAKDSLHHSDRKIINIQKDEQGQLYFCGNFGAFFRLDPKTFRLQFYDIPTSEKIPNNTVFAMHSDGSHIYLALQCGIVRINIESKEQQVMLPDEHLVVDKKQDINAVYGIVPDKKNENKLWILTRGGLLSFNKQSERFKYHTKTYDSEVNYMTTQLWIGEVDEQETLWLGGGHYGLKWFDTKKEEWKFFIDPNYYPTKDPPNIIREFYKKSETETWVLSVTEGLGILDKSTSLYHYFKYEPDNPQSMQKGKYHRMFKDRDGNFWIGGKNGVSFYIPNLQQVNKIKFSPSTAFQSDFPIHSIKWEQLNEREALVGTILGNGLYKADLKNKSMAEVDRLVIKSKNGVRLSSLVKENKEALIIRDIFKTSNGEILVTETQAVYIYNESKNQLETCDYPFAEELRNKIVTNFIEDKRKNYWCLINHKEVIHIDGKNKNIIKRYNLSTLIDEENNTKNEFLHAIAEDQQGNIWIGANSHLIKIDKNGVVNRPMFENKVINDFVFSQTTDLEISRENKLYLSSGYQGILELDLNDVSQFKIFKKENGLPEDNILTLDIDHSNELWLTSENGLFLFNPSTSKSRAFYQRHGLPEDNFLLFWTPNLEISKQGNVFFYSADYLAWMHEDGFKTLVPDVQPRINSFEVLDDPSATLYNFESNQEISIDHQQNYFNIHFGTTDYSLTKDLKFKYQLEGFDDQWRISNTAQANYTKVPPGEYEFSVMATDFLGNWSATPASIKINIIPPFWQATWFRVLALLTFLCLAYFAYRFWANQLREKERLKNEFEKKISQIEMDALRAQMNPHFLFNCLNSIRNYALTKGPYETADYLTKFSHLIRLILQNSKTPTVLLGDELEALKLYIEIEDLRFEDQFDYEFNIDKGLDLQSSQIPPLILQPYVENAIWHGLMHKEDGKGKLLVEIKNIGGILQCMIEDNGIGREKSAELSKRKNGIRKKSLGMKITNDRIELTNQLYKTQTSVKIVDLKNKMGEAIGTRVLVNIPIMGFRGD